MSDDAVQLHSIVTPELSESINPPGEGDFETWRLSVPAKGACYVLEDGAGRAILVSTCADLRRALARRLGPGDDAEELSKRIDYRGVTRRIRWRMVSGRFEADWVYLETVRAVLPRRYAKLTRGMRAHWVAVDPGAAHPRFVATDSPSGDPRYCFGPTHDSKSARKLIEVLEDLFDLCRYHHILVQAPGGQACSYKQMGRCPAPCDGTVTMDAYRRQVWEAVAFLIARGEGWVKRFEVEMAQAAAKQEYEAANRFKQLVERAGTLAAPAYAHLMPLSTFRWVVLQRGGRRGYVRAFTAVGDVIVYLGECEADEGSLRAVAERAVEARAQRVGSPTPSGAPERLGLVCRYLFTMSDGGRRGAAIRVVPVDEACNVANLLEAAAAVTSGAEIPDEVLEQESNAA